MRTHETLHSLSQPEVNDRFADIVYGIGEGVLKVPADIEGIAEELIDSTAETGLGQDLREKYGLNYNPEQVVRGLGKLALPVINPETLIDKTVEAAAAEQNKSNKPQQEIDAEFVSMIGELRRQAREAASA